VLCGPSRDARSAHYRDLSDAPDFLLAEIANFFEVYKLIEPDKSTEVGGWNGVAEAEKEIAAAIARYVP
jgi:inorganic pyrophosphatase